jgi:hypothetical protein
LNIVLLISEFTYSATMGRISVSSDAVETAKTTDVVIEVDSTIRGTKFMIISN